jgi:hypothetical protein
MAIDAKEAATKAASYYKELTGTKDWGVTLEEIEFDEDKNQWLITLGLTSTAFANIAPMGLRPHAYKLFRIDAETGEVKSMKIRELNNPNR